MTAERVLELLAALASAGVRTTVDGGWGVDALLGRQTRPHGDLDLVVALGDVERTRAALDRAGFSMAEDHLPVRFVLRNPAGEQLDFHTVRFDEQGDGLQPQPGGGSFRYPPEGFVRGVIGGKGVACISAEVQVLCHLGYTPTRQDADDVLALCRAFGLPTPEAYGAFPKQATWLAQLDPARPPLRWLLDLPQHLYRAKLGWLLGRRFLQLTTRGRKTGARRMVVLEVLGRDAESGGFFIASAWGARAQWLRNLEASPRAEVQVGRRRFSAAVTRLSEEAGAEQLRRYAEQHPWAYRLFIGPLLLGRRPGKDAGEFAELGRRIPVLLIRPAP